jgi:hypothetical protein
MFFTHYLQDPCVECCQELYFSKVIHTLADVQLLLHAPFTNSRSLSQKMAESSTFCEQASRHIAAFEFPQALDAALQATKSDDLK